MSAAGQSWNPETYAANARFVADLGMPVVELLDPQPGETILDLGCGDGALTERLAACGCEVVGIDASPEQIAAAKRRGLNAMVADGNDFDLGHTFDAVFSNAALHWMREPQRVLQCVYRALKPGGRFVGEMGGAGNTATVSAAIRSALARRGLDYDALSPWYFPTVEQYRRELVAAVLEVRSIDLFPRPTKLPGELVDWLKTFAGAFTCRLSESDRNEFLSEVTEECRPKLFNADDVWIVDYVRLRFAAIRL
jgi:trans-aconitate methyltransferase